MSLAATSTLATSPAAAPTAAASPIGAPTAAARTASTVAAPPAAAATTIRARAAAYRRGLRAGEPVARISFPRARRRPLVRAGLDQETIDRGPGWYQRSWLPGEGRLIYLAGHNRSHGGPFGPVAKLRRGDTVVLTLPYATATYRVTGRRLVSERDLSILRGGRSELLRLQTSTVPSSDRRIVVSARPTRLAPR
ncbi:sortase [Conexibacter stalactiti]|uniref:Sortase n=1 Tax=Conexibacter stalactiti TaxID=1940611 RepID=A0ABU4HU88_9ACTN|nr:sortase [Conexibacter stalactiti]MDW5596858.1 sortase [Conexibacter stalactiti]MEC5037500.1 sortase [Conexibacter stalactiti]